MLAGTLLPLLPAYIARRALLAIMVAFLIVFALIYVIDFVEVARRLGDEDNVGVLDMMQVSLERAPGIAGETLPFTVLFGAIGAFVGLSRRLELVVGRASGFSIWQIVAPACIVAAIVGILATAAYNPVSAWLTEQSADLTARLSAKAPPTGGRWIRQQSVDDQSIIRAQSSSERGRILRKVTAFVFTQSGALQERVDADKATLRDGYWELDRAHVVRIGATPENHQSYLLATNLTAQQVADSLSDANAIGFWALPSVILSTERAGLSPTKFQMQYQSLIAQPAMFVTMILIAATVSLGFSRTGGVAKAVVGGIGAGFVLYVLGKVAEDLGAAGFVAPAVAAWTPAVIGALMSVTVLLHREDG
jgi:lipopolysaccharide export system permease protein